MININLLNCRLCIGSFKSRVVVVGFHLVEYTLIESEGDR